jgi:hypothetical protein
LALPTLVGYREVKNKMLVAVRADMVALAG